LEKAAAAPLSGAARTKAGATKQAKKAAPRKR
jgi:hypothetical protein